MGNGFVGFLVGIFIAGDKLAAGGLARQAGTKTTTRHNTIYAFALP